MEVRRVSINVREMPIRQALTTLLKGTGRKVRFEGAISARVTARFREVEVDAAIDSICNDLNLAWRKEGSTYVITEKTW